MRQFCPKPQAVLSPRAPGSRGQRPARRGSCRGRQRQCPAFQRRTPMGFLTGKKLLITRLLSNRSIAYGIARACRAQGAELAFSYVGERFKARTGDFAAE